MAVRALPPCAAIAWESGTGTRRHHHSLRLTHTNIYIPPPTHTHAPSRTYAPVLPDTYSHPPPPHTGEGDQRFRGKAPRLKARCEALAAQLAAAQEASSVLRLQLEGAVTAKGAAQKLLQSQLKEARGREAELREK